MDSDLNLKAGGIAVAFWCVMFYAGLTDNDNLFSFGVGGITYFWILISIVGKKLKNKEKST